MDVRHALAPSDELGESPLWPAAAILAAAGLYADLPSRFIAGGGAFGVIRWVVPALTVLVLITLGVVRPSGPIARALDWPTRTLQENSRRLSIAVIALVSAANSASIILLVHLLVNGAHATAPTLLRAAHCALSGLV